MKTKLITLALLLLASAAAAQPHIGHGVQGLPHGMPDFCEQEGVSKIVVSLGDTFTVNDAKDTGCLGVHGKLVVEAGGSILLDELLVYDDGGVDLMPGSEIITRDKPLDLVFDPEQFGQGLLVFGRFFARGCTIRSQNPAGVRGHNMSVYRADVDVEGCTIRGMGRTKAGVPIDNAIYDSEGVLIRTGENQQGRYGGWHNHHVMGLFPPQHQYQCRLVGNIIDDAGKWGLVAHNTSHCLFEDNIITRTMVGIVTEDGSEKNNIFNRNIIKDPPPTPASCRGVNNYDPEGDCPAGFWLRSVGNIVTNNIVDGMQRGIAFWTGCLEIVLPHHCALASLVTVPLFQGADTRVLANIETCQGGDGSPVYCTVRHRRGGTVDGNTIRNADAGLEFWWTPWRQFNNSPATNTVIENVKVPVLTHYSDIHVDGLVARGCGVLVDQFNDGAPIGWGLATSIMSHIDAVCDTAIYTRSGQLRQAWGWLWQDSILDAPLGIVITGGGQGSYPPHQNVTLRNLVMPHGTFSLTTSTRGGDDVLPDQSITLTAENVNGMNTVLHWPVAVPPPPAGVPAAPTGVRVIK